MKPQGRPATTTPAAVNPQTMDRQTFLANVRQSGLLSPDQFAKACRKLPDNNRGVAIAKAMMDGGYLTRFQAEILLHGKTSGFFLGQYKILDHLGRGGMGRVYKAEHQTMNRVVAVKVLASHLVKTPKAQQMFQREVRAAARLVHPHIVTAYDANSIGDRCYLVMEYVDGANLEEIVKQHGPLPIGTACDFIRQAAIGLQYAHEMGMVHRDIKPANLLVQRPPSRTPHAVCNVKILDFGLARLQTLGPGQGNESLPAAENSVLGTPDFLSPEQARNVHTVDIRSDLYSLGCTLYFILTGKVPFPSGTTLEKLVRHSTEAPVPVEKLRPDLSPPIANIVKKLLSKDAKGRYQTPAELANALAPYSVQSTPPSPVPGGYSQSGVPTPSGASAWTATTPSHEDEEVALGTLPLNVTGTPLSITGLPSTRLQNAIHDEQQRMRLILIGAITAIGFLIAGIGLLLVLK